MDASIHMEEGGKKKESNRNKGGEKLGTPHTNNVKPRQVTLSDLEKLQTSFLYSVLKENRNY